MLEVRIKDLKKLIAIDRVILYNRPILGPGTYENDGLADVGGGVMAPAIQLSGQWKRVGSTQASGGTYDTGSSIEDQIVFSVKNATSVVLYRRLYSKYGMADVYVDGQYFISYDSFVARQRRGSSRSRLSSPAWTRLQPRDQDRAAENRREAHRLQAARH